MDKNVLITGGTGLLGTRLTQLLKEKGYNVLYLSREKKKTMGVEVFQWDINKQYIDKEALKKANHIIHLAGAGIADKPWTDDRKKEIIDSRIESTQLLFNALQESVYSIKTFVSASAIGYYGMDTGQQILEETALKGKDFLAEVTTKWEDAVQNVMSTGIRTVMIRIGIVLSQNGGALPKMMVPVKWGAGVPLGDGNQYMSWIHVDDLCAMFIKAIEDNTMTGPYNAVAPNPVTNKEFTKQLAKQLHRFMLPLYMPAFLLKLILGEMALVVTGGNNVSCKRILEEGFSFKFRTLEKALEDLLPYSS